MSEKIHSYDRSIHYETGESEWLRIKNRMISSISDLANSHLEQMRENNFLRFSVVEKGG